MAQRSMAQGWEQMCPLCPAAALLGEERWREQGNACGGASSHTAARNENFWRHTHTHKSVGTWAHIDGRTLSEGLASSRRLKQEFIQKSHARRHTSNIFYSSKHQLGNFCCTSISSAAAALPSSLPIRQVLLLPRWLHPPMPLTASWGVLLDGAAGSRFTRTAQTLACGNATPPWVKEELHWHLFTSFFPHVVNYTNIHMLLGFRSLAALFIVILVGHLELTNPKRHVCSNLFNYFFVSHLLRRMTP